MFRLQLDGNLQMYCSSGILFLVKCMIVYVCGNASCHVVVLMLRVGVMIVRQSVDLDQPCMWEKILLTSVHSQVLNDVGVNDLDSVTMQWELEWG